MMAGNPNLWRNIIYPSVFPSQYVVGSSSSLPLNSFGDQIQEFPQSLSQLLLQGGCWDGDEERYMGASSHFQSKRLEIYEDQILNPSVRRVPVVDVKQEELVSQNRNLCGHGDEEFQEATATVWSQMMPASSPRSCVTSLSTSLLEFSHNKADYNSTASGGVCKKARVHPSCCSQPPLKVRKEKLGDRITALHQLVSPFGKTDTASVLLEAIGYIRFLQSQIEALSSPYLTNASVNTRNLQQSGTQEKAKDLRSRGLCLVPMSCTMQVGSDNGADYWAPAPY